MRALFLPQGSRLNEVYTVDKVVRVCGFGLTYRVRDDHDCPSPSTGHLVAGRLFVVIALATSVFYGNSLLHLMWALKVSEPDDGLKPSQSSLC